MKSFHMRRMSSLILSTIMFAGLLCANSYAENKDKADMPVEHKMSQEEYQRGLQEAKKIVVARVNGVGITLKDLMDRMNQLASVYIPESHQRTPEIDQAVKHEALDILIFRELAVQEAARQGMKVPPEMTANFIRDFKKSLGSEEAYRDYLKKTDSTEESLKKDFERNQLFDMIVSKEVYLEAGSDEQAIEKRKQEWEAELKKNAKIDILLEEVEKKMRKETEKSGGK